MSFYLIIGATNYEGSEVIAVFTDKEKANSFFKDYTMCCFEFDDVFLEEWIENQDDEKSSFELYVQNKLFSKSWLKTKNKKEFKKRR